ncbi:uncharacterized protein LOC133704839 isoform X2 [Populus nigra]|uniref:uncharacterized protein LOC133704839 isoform X2 n=1 Tax=Populus nigra TaxID=3691 RepID=UPI002B276CE1|nr:uncharacterized protein LOC133704839 isoform X2 [Populus nigra]
MGCFLGCFCLSSRRKRRKPASRDQKLGRYELLDSVSTDCGTAGNSITSEAELSKRPKESLNYKVRKKVSFNLNVKTYEPLPKEECRNDYWESDEEETDKVAAKERQSSSISEGDSSAFKMASYPSNYRYRNCVDSYDEEYEVPREESDLDDEEEEFDEEDEDDDNNGCDIDELRVNQKELFGQFSSLSVSSQKRNSLTKLGEEGTTENLKPLGDSNEGGLRSRQYVHSVLKPVENLSQWKAVKAKGTQPPKQQRKENVASEQHPPLSSLSNISHSTALMQEIAVDASLSNWVVPPDSYQNKTASNDVETNPLKKSLFDSTYPWRNKEDTHISDIANSETC